MLFCHFGYLNDVTRNSKVAPFFCCPKCFDTQAEARKCLPLLIKVFMSVFQIVLFIFRVKILVYQGVLHRNKRST